MNEMTGIDSIINNNIYNINCPNNNNFWSYPLQPQYDQISINTEESANNNLNVNIVDNLNQDESGLFIDGYYMENKSIIYDDIK